MSDFSVVICTYNPVQHIFSKCLDSILEAAKICKPSEIIIIDNNSNNRFDQEEYFRDFIEVSNAKLINESKQGLTPARLRGIASSSSDVLVFVDDDNILRADFFEKGIKIAEKHPHIGAWSGQVKLVFEEKPPAWTKQYWGLLVHREFSVDKWSNLPLLDETMPCGAGLFVRMQVASLYRQLHLEGKRTIQLDRTATSLLSGGDNDLAGCACDLGLGVGLFKDIVVDHFIPSKRLKLDYLLNLASGIWASSVIFKSYRGELPQRISLKRKLVNILRFLFMKRRERAFYIATLKGQKQGKQILRACLKNKG
ncbi:glycosyltransferase [Haliscomenobacter sp.]|uniref:glycosyltransferase n=1 Tax=Haliscomenobacter sp. TaxID=2717303 RepID=UPI003BACC3B3